MNTRVFALSALGALTLGASLFAQPAPVLQLDGQTSITRSLGDSYDITLTGTPGRFAALFLDVNPGPIVLFGKTVPLGLTASLVTVPLGNLPAGGTATLTTRIPNWKLLHGAQVFFAGVVSETGTVPGLNWSNGADLTINDRGAQLAGNSLGQYPFFEAVRAINRGSSVEVAVDTSCYPSTAGAANLYVVASKTAAQWDADPSLTDVRGGSQAITLAAATLNTVTVTGSLAGPDESAGSGDTRVGIGYDVVVDVNRDGQLNGADLIDGYDDTQAGFYICRDTARGGLKTSANRGPYGVTEILYSGGAQLQQDTYYPTNIASLGRLPLVVVSHGNGHNYQWYDHIGYHLASYGYVVMSHFNNTIPGSQTAAITTLNNTDYIIGNQGTIMGGVLNGHIDSNNITWIGHSRGGDGVARAYDRLFRGSFTPTNYAKADVQLVSSIAPVDFGGTTGNPASHPRDVPAYHLWVAQADADVNGCPTFGNQIKWYLLHDRARRNRASTSLYGVGHGDYHDGGGSSVASGPSLIGRNNTHGIMRGYLLPLVEHYIRGDVPSRDFLWRQYESFRAVSAPTGANIVANLVFQDERASGKFVIDDFQEFPSESVASSGAAVTRSGLANYNEGRNADNNTNFTWQASDPFNGWLHDSTSAQFRTNSFGVVFDYQSDSNLTYTMLPGQRDFSDFNYLSFRAAQGTRHPRTTAELGDVTFTVTLEDTSGATSSINIGAYGGGIEEPYQRNTGPSCGSGFGWNSEYETVKIRLGDYQNNGCFDLRNVSKVIFNFGPSWGSSQGRIGLDEIELTLE